MSYNLVQQNPETGELYLKNIAGGSGSDIEQFIGTQQEWNDLPAADKAKYDGKEVIITDDYEEDDKKLNWSYSKITLPYTVKNDAFCVVRCNPNTSSISYLYLTITRGSEKIYIPQSSTAGVQYSLSTPVKKGDVLSVETISNVKNYDVDLYEA